jgi:hypothetical protein
MMILIFKQEGEPPAGPAAPLGRPFVNGAIVGSFYCLSGPPVLFVVKDAYREPGSGLSPAFFRDLAGNIRAVAQIGGRIVSEGWRGGLYTLAAQRRISTAPSLLVFVLCALLLRKYDAAAAPDGARPRGARSLPFSVSAFFILQNSVVDPPHHLLPPVRPRDDFRFYRQEAPEKKNGRKRALCCSPLC